MRDFEGQGDYHKYFGIQQHQITSAKQLSELNEAVNRKKSQEVVQARRFEVAQLEREKLEEKRFSEQLKREIARDKRENRRYLITTAIAVVALIISLIKG